MDSGEEIQGLGEDWSFLGAKLAEWLAGFATFIIVAEVVFKGHMGQGMPIMILCWIVTTVGLASLRAKFPDQEKGVRNYFATLCGFAPPFIPTPSALQKFWSGAPVRRLPDDCEFMQLGLGELLPSHNPHLEEV